MNTESINEWEKLRYVFGVRDPLTPTFSLKSVRFLVITLSQLNVCYHGELMVLSDTDCCRHHHCHLVNGQPALNSTHLCFYDTHIAKLNVMEVISKGMA